MKKNAPLVIIIVVRFKREGGGNKQRMFAIFPNVKFAHYKRGSQCKHRCLRVHILTSFGKKQIKTVIGVPC